MPSRGRGLDFEHRFNTSRWAEDIVLSGLKDSDLVAVRLGLSEVKKASELTGRQLVKVPDLLVFDRKDLSVEEIKVLADGDLSGEEPSSFEADGTHAFCYPKALAAIEIEFSPYKATEMAGRHWKPKSDVQLARRSYKHANPPTAPNIWVKVEDLEPLQAWQSISSVPIVVAHLFDQEAFAISLELVSGAWAEYASSPGDLINRQLRSGIFLKKQNYNRQDAEGAGEQKLVIIVTPASSVHAGLIQGVEVKAQLGMSTSKKYVAHVLFCGGRIQFSGEFLSLLRTARAAGRLL